MTTLREAAQQALEALRGYRREIDCHQPCDAERGLEAALAQQEQEPIIKCTVVDNQHPNGTPFEQWVNAPHPPRREWRLLSEEEINALPEIGGVMWGMGTAPAVLRAIRAIEAALKEKNHD